MIIINIFCYSLRYVLHCMPYWRLQLISTVSAMAPKSALLNDKPEHKCDIAESEAASMLSRDSSSWPISLSGCDHMKCLLCGCHIKDKSVLTSPLLLAKYGDTFPWRKYRPIVTETIRRPVGKLCAISVNVFNALGLAAEWNNDPMAYAEFINKPENAAEGRRFATAQAEWIKMFNEQEEGGTEIRLKNPKEYGNV